MWTYRKKENLFYKLHPFTMFFFVVVILIIALCFDHPAILFGSLMGTGVVLIASGNGKEWLQFMKISLSMIFMIAFINVIMVNEGTTVLYSGPVLPVMGKFKITFEALCYAAGMGIRLLLMTSAFCIYNSIVDPDQALKLFSKWGTKSVLMITMTTRLFPLMLSDFKRISEVQRTRGVDYSSGKVRERIKRTLPVMSALLLSSLERAFQTAESMHARGYGTGERTLYTKLIWRIRDFLITGISVLILVACGSIWTFGWGTYTYYPSIQSVESASLWASLGLFVLLCLPAMIGWGWKKWHILKLKI